MIPLTTLYDGYIDQSKLTEQKNPFEYIIHPPTSGVGTIMIFFTENLDRPVPISTKTENGHIKKHPTNRFSLVSTELGWVCNPRYQKDQMLLIRESKINSQCAIFWDHSMVIAMILTFFLICRKRWFYRFTIWWSEVFKRGWNKNYHFAV